MKYLAVVFFVFVIVAIILVDSGNLPHSIRALYDFPNGDKLGHFVLFGLLTFFLTRAFLSSLPAQLRGWVALSISLVLALFISLEEFSQQYFSTRTFDLVDLFFSYAGVITFAFLAVIWKSPHR